MRRFGRVVLGGTFDRLHVGHEALLGAAFQAGRHVAIGVTSSRYLAEHPKPGGTAIASAPARRRALARWLRQHQPGRRWTIVPIDDRFGGSVGPDVDALVVSADTLEGGRAVNRERRRLGRRPVPVLVVPLVLADDLEPVSSRRIRAGEIDRQGHRRSPLAVGVVADDPADGRAAVAGVRRTFPQARPQLGVGVRGQAAPSAIARRRAIRASRSADLGLGIARSRRGWFVAVRGRRAALPPRRIAGDDPQALAAGVAALLRAGRAKRI